MRNHPLPLITSLAHGGLTTPPSVTQQLTIDATTIYNECDLWVEQLYDFAHADLAPWIPAAGQPGVLASVTMPIARVLVDVNRDPDDLGQPDGPIKTMTSYGAPVYRKVPDEEQQQALLEANWHPYHRALEAALRTHANGAKLLLDCHNMAQHGPAAYHFPGAARPLICLANLGDAHGDPQPRLGWTTCSGELLRAAGAIAAELFADLALLEPTPGEAVPTVALNWPFAGGYIIQRYSQGTLTRPALPAMMIEVNRGLFVGDQTMNTSITAANEPAIAQIRQRLYQWATRVAALL